MMIPNQFQLNLSAAWNIYFPRNHIQRLCFEVKVGRQMSDRRWACCTTCRLEQWDPLFVLLPTTFINTSQQCISSLFLHSNMKWLCIDYVCHWLQAINSFNKINNKQCSMHSVHMQPYWIPVQLVIVAPVRVFLTAYPGKSNLWIQRERNNTSLH